MWDDDLDLGAVPVQVAMVPRAQLKAKAPAAVMVPRAAQQLGGGMGGGVRGEYALGFVELTGAVAVLVTGNFVATRTFRPKSVQVGITDGAGVTAGNIFLTQLQAGDDTIKPGPGAIPQVRLTDPQQPCAVLPRIIKAGTPIIVTITRSTAPGAGITSHYDITFDAEILD
jgi:hypothetical protein